MAKSFPLVLIGLILGPAACAPGVANPAAAATPSEPLSGAMRVLDFYVGDWDCEGTEFTAEGRTAKQWTARAVVRKEARGRWVSVRMAGPGNNQSVEFKGYDVNEKRWVHAWASGSGRSGKLVASGWEGNRMTFVPEPADPEDKHHAIFTKISDNQYSHRVEVDSGKGYQPSWEKVCTKRSAPA